MSNPARGPKVSAGDVVTVLEWDGGQAIAPHVGTTQHAKFALIRVSHPSGLHTHIWGRGLWASSWRLPAPEELTAYQLSQLTGGGL